MNGHHSQSRVEWNDWNALGSFNNFLHWQREKEKGKEREKKKKMLVTSSLVQINVMFFFSPSSSVLMTKSSLAGDLPSKF